MTKSDFEEGERTLVDWDRKLADFRADSDQDLGHAPCSHGDDSAEECDNCEKPRCTECLDICPCVAMEAKGIHLSFGSITRCCFCAVIRTGDGGPSFIHVRARWGHAYAHYKCIFDRAVRLETRLDEVLAKEEPLSDVFSIIFDQVLPDLFKEVDRGRIMLWCEMDEAEVH